MIRSLLLSLIVLTGSLFFLLCPSPLMAAEEGMVFPVSVSVTDSEITLSAELQSSLPTHIEAEVREGMPKDLSFEILLMKRNPLWFDEKILSKKILLRVRFDLVKRQFVVSRMESEPTGEVILEDFEQVAHLISRVKNVKIASPLILDSSATYYVSVRARMRATKVPLYLDYFFFFLRFFELDTPWTNSSEFSPPSRQR